LIICFFIYNFIEKYLLIILSKNESEIKNYIEKFFKWLEIKISSLEIKKKEKNIYFIKLESIDSSLLIGKDWDTIEDIKNILKICVNRFSDEKIKIVLDINGYHKTYEQKLFWKVDKAIINLDKYGWEYDLWALCSYDRKRIHSYVARNYSEIISKSRWEWKKRRIFLLLKNELNRESKDISKKLTIDIDGDSI